MSNAKFFVIVALLLWIIADCGPLLHSMIRSDSEVARLAERGMDTVAAMRVEHTIWTYAGTAALLAAAVYWYLGR